LCVENLHLRREERPVLQGVNLKVASGQIYGLLGRNGSGKSSLAYALMGCGACALQEGRILFDGHDITGLSITERGQLGLTLAWQEPARFEGLKVQDYLALGMQEPSRERMEEALKAVALLPSAYLSRPVDETLSGGERKRIELAAVYAMRPSSVSASSLPRECRRFRRSSRLARGRGPSSSPTALSPTPSRSST